MIKAILPHVTAVFTISSQQSILFKKIFPDFPDWKIVVSPNGINHNVFNVRTDVDRSEARPSLWEFRFAQADRVIWNF